MKDNRMLLHAYPISDPAHAMASNYPGYQESYDHHIEEESSKPKADPAYIKKLEYSADKIQLSAKRSAKKRSAKKHERSCEPTDQSRGFFEIQKHDRKNTLSGHKRT